MRTDTTILASAMYAMAMDIQSDDGIANAAIEEAGDRLIEQCERILELETLIIKRYIDEPTTATAKLIAEKIKQYIPNGDGYHSEYAGDLTDAVEFLESLSTN